MNIAFISIVIVLEALVGGFVVWGFLHEDRFISFEARVAQAFRMRPMNKKRAAKRLRVVSDKTGRNDPDFTAA